MSKYPDFVPQDIIFFYEKNWEKKKDGLPSRATNAAYRLVTDERMRSVYETLKKQSPCQNWGQLLTAMIWPVLHTHEYKVRVKEDEKEYRKTLEQAIIAAEKLSRLLSDLHSAHRRDNFFEFIVYIFHEVTLFSSYLGLVPLERFHSPNEPTDAVSPDSFG